jgi:hypothetical protein
MLNTTPQAAIEMTNGKAYGALPSIPPSCTWPIMLRAKRTSATTNPMLKTSLKMIFAGSSLRLSERQKNQPVNANPNNDRIELMTICAIWLIGECSQIPPVRPSTQAKFTALLARPRPIKSSALNVSG